MSSSKVWSKEEDKAFENAIVVNMGNGPGIITHEKDKTPFCLLVGKAPWTTRRTPCRNPSERISNLASKPGSGSGGSWAGKAGGLAGAGEDAAEGLEQVKEQTRVGDS